MAATVDTRDSKSNSPRLHTPHLRGKNKNSHLLSVKQNRSKNPGDVWERIRSGMKIPRPSQVTALPDQARENTNGLPKPVIIRKRFDVSLDPAKSSGTVINGAPLISAKAQSDRMLALQKLRLPDTVAAPQYQYTPYGRLKLNAALSSRVRNRTAVSEPSVATRDPTLDENSAYQTRVRSRIDVHPGQHKLDLTLPTELLADSTLRQGKPVKTSHFDQPENAPLPATTGQRLTAVIPRDTKEAIKYERVNKHVIWYTQHSSYLHQVAEHARPYLYHIVESLSQHHLPYELALLPIVESAYQPTALSPKSAAGLWQFIPSTGHDFDLQQNEQYDARLDITASTQAAMRYMSFLNQHFNGDWLLALAAYNCGLGTVDNAINRNVADGLETDYWSLRLPEETQQYVPRFLALSSIFANPDAHGLKFAQIRNEPYFVKVKIDRKQDIEYLAEKEFKEVAQLANLSYEQFIRLNPGYLDPKLTTDGPYTFLMPATNADQLHQRLDSIAQFINKSPVLAASHAPLKRNVLSTVDDQQVAISLLTDITLPKGTDLVHDSDPFLSLNVDANQTTPRIVKQSVMPQGNRIKKLL
jgi:hypothetical protein